MPGQGVGGDNMKGEKVRKEKSFNKEWLIILHNVEKLIKIVNVSHPEKAVINKQKLIECIGDFSKWIR